MPAPSPSPLPTSLEQQRKLAKDLIRAARAGDPAAFARIRAARSDAGTPQRALKLADAQRVVAREAGFESWPALVADFEERDIRAFVDAVNGGDLERTQRLLASTHVRERINDPLFAFGARAAHAAAKNERLLALLIEAGADVNRTSDWQNGPYTVLDHANEHTARFLLSRGATLTPNVAARLGWIDELRRLIDADPALVHARGGDGQQPLHEAKTVEIADFLLERSAGIDVPCIDHHSTPAQYALADRPDVSRRLLEHGARPDIFMAARLGDVRLATKLLDADPGCVAARINEAGYDPVPPFNIYCWSLGFGLSPHDVATRFGHGDVQELLTLRSPARVRLVQAILAADEAGANVVIAEHPTALATLVRERHGYMAHVIFNERFDAAELMLRLGFDPADPGIDGGSALHAACWVGSVRLVALLLERGGVAVDSRDPTHGSTPLGWAAFGSVHRRAKGADYAGVVDRLVDAGADVRAPGNGEGRTLLEMARGNAEMQATLRRHGVS